MTRQARPPAPRLPSTVDAMLTTSQAAAALGLRPNRFRELVHKGQLPGHDGTLPWAPGKKFWRASTINAVIDAATTTPREGPHADPGDD